MPVLSDSWVVYDDHIGPIDSYVRSVEVYGVTQFESITGVTYATGTVLNLTTALGYQVYLTPDTKIQIDNYESGYIYIPASSIASGDLAAINLNKKWPTHTLGIINSLCYDIGYVIAANNIGACPCVEQFQTASYITSRFFTQLDRDYFTNYSNTSLSLFPQNLDQNNYINFIAGLFSIYNCSGYSRCYLHDRECNYLSTIDGNILSVKNCTDNNVYHDWPIYYNSGDYEVKFVSQMLNSCQIITLNSGNYILIPDDTSTSDNLELFRLIIQYSANFDLGDKTLSDTITTITETTGTYVTLGSTYITANCFNIMEP